MRPRDVPQSGPLECRYGKGGAGLSRLSNHHPAL
nr:MAG TPA: hypothetical protein [Caudoviricetes sp.]